MPVITCKAPGRKLERCGSFVARFSGHIRFVGMVRHSNEAKPGNEVVQCRRCGALHEIERIARTTWPVGPEAA